MGELWLGKGDMIYHLLKTTLCFQEAVMSQCTRKAAAAVLCTQVDTGQGLEDSEKTNPKVQMEPEMPTAD